MHSQPESHPVPNFARSQGPIQHLLGRFRHQYAGRHTSTHGGGNNRHNSLDTRAEHACNGHPTAQQMADFSDHLNHRCLFPMNLDPKRLSVVYRDVRQRSITSCFISDCIVSPLPGYASCHRFQSSSAIVILYARVP
jgi:hypothetical protein